MIGDASSLLGRLQAAHGSGYAVERELGGGGMSRVFVARDLRLERDIVIKVLASEARARERPLRARRDFLLARMGCERMRAPRPSRAVAGPSQPEALMLSARLHLVRGDRGAMHESMEAAVRADPIGYGTRWYYIVILYLAGAFDRSIAEADRMLADAPGFADARRWRGKARCLAGDVVGGLDDLQRAAEAAPPHAWLLGELSIALSANGRGEDAAKIRDELIERSERGWIPPTAIVLAELAMNDWNGVFRWCERAFQTRDFLCVMFPFEGMFGVRLPGQEDPIVDDARWLELARRVGMAP